jgi:hypothetical protein
MTELQLNLLGVIANSKVRVNVQDGKLISFHNKLIPSEAKISDFEDLETAGYIKFGRSAEGATVYITPPGRKLLNLGPRGPEFTIVSDQTTALRT